MTKVLGLNARIKHRESSESEPIAMAPAGAVGSFAGACMNVRVLVDRAVRR